MSYFNIKLIGASSNITVGTMGIWALSSIGQILFIKDFEFTNYIIECGNN